MLTGDTSAGVQVNIPVTLSKLAPLGRVVMSWRLTLSPSGSVVVTVNERLIPTVTLKMATAWMRGLPLAKHRTNNIKSQEKPWNSVSLCDSRN